MLTHKPMTMDQGFKGSEVNQRLPMKVGRAPASPKPMDLRRRIHVDSIRKENGKNEG